MNYTQKTHLHDVMNKPFDLNIQDNYILDPVSKNKYIIKYDELNKEKNKEYFDVKESPELNKSKYTYHPVNNMFLFDNFNYRGNINSKPFTKCENIPAFEKDFTTGDRYTFIRNDNNTNAGECTIQGNDISMGKNTYTVSRMDVGYTGGNIDFVKKFTNDNN